MTIAATLRDRIADRVHAVGDSLPTGKALASEFGVSRDVVRKALAALEAEGLVTLGRGAPATVVAAPSAEPPPAPQAAGVMLPDRVRAAFEAEHVTIDSFSLTAETLQDALAYAYQGVRSRELTPRSITLRVMVPAIDTRLALPRLVDDASDQRPLERLRDIMGTCHHALDIGLTSLRLGGLVETASLEFRSVALTPMHKLYVLNGTETLIGYYQVQERTVRDRRREEMDIYDVLGIEATLFRSTSGPDGHDPQGAAFVESSKHWFDSLWNSIARPIGPG